MLQDNLLHSLSQVISLDAELQHMRTSQEGTSSHIVMFFDGSSVRSKKQLVITPPSDFGAFREKYAVMALKTLEHPVPAGFQADTWDSHRLLVFSVAHKRVSHDHEHEHEHDHHTTSRLQPTRQRVSSLLQGHPGLWGTPVGPGRTPTVHQCPKGKAVGGPHETTSDRRPKRHRQASRQTCFQRDRC